MLLSSPVKTCARVKNRATRSLLSKAGKREQKPVPEQLNDLYDVQLFCHADGTTQKQGDSNSRTNDSFESVLFSESKTVRIFI